ncbi:MAG TPA: DUF1588 domain-containing protein [Oligoflexus sp.]|uniref:DUF1588 domain-containing protein n=1 Tax=Oligoflexus sp. TaxID=1971216 RepID=UPI002D4AD6F9|nr:DUF1588 domain-containing protein [Oligoflexus sp.]HYX35358.1 DUF1588 domain-containing protein [Oligoflexus sp.]
MLRMSCGAIAPYIRATFILFSASWILVSCLSKQRPRSQPTSEADAQVFTCQDYEPPFAKGYDFTHHILPFVTRHCINCHNDTTASGGIRLDIFEDSASIFTAQQRWKKALDQVNSERMPPARNLHTCETKMFNQWIADGLLIDAQDPTKTGDSLSRSTAIVDPLRRLTKKEYTNTIRDLMGPKTFARISDQISLSLNEDPSQPFERMGLTLSASMVSAFFYIAEAAAESAVTEDLGFGTDYPCLKATDLSSDCITSFITNFGMRAFRRPITAEEFAKAHGIYEENLSEGQKVGLKSVVSWFLQSPNFLYHLEVDGTENDGLLKVGPFALASRLSYLAFGSMPDDELLMLASTGKLETFEEAEQQSARIFSSPRARTWVQEFYDQWLHLNRLKTVSYGEFSEQFLADRGIRDASTIVESALAESHAFLDYITWERKGNFADLMQSTVMVKTQFDFPTSIYQTNFPPGQDLVLLSRSSRRGILTRVATLFQKSEETSPIHRGAGIRQQILCDEITPPPSNLFPPGTFDLPPFDPNMTARQRWEQKTASEPCYTCHTRINPLGFAMEMYDTLGKVRLEEPARDLSGGFIRMLPIDLAMVPNIDNSAEAPANGPLELIDRIAVSEKANFCFVRQWFRYAMGRRETGNDRETLQILYNELTRPGGGIQVMLSKSGSILKAVDRKIEP